jgi:enterobactin synthetase component F
VDRALLLRIATTNATLGDEFRPRTLTGNLVVFTATEDRLPGDPTWSDWRPYVTGELVHHPVPANHHALLDPAALDVIGPLLGRHLDELDLPQHQ